MKRKNYFSANERKYTQIFKNNYPQINTDQNIDCFKYLCLPVDLKSFACVVHEK